MQKNKLTPNLKALLDQGKAELGIKGNPTKIEAFTSLDGTSKIVQRTYSNAVVRYETPIKGGESILTVTGSKADGSTYHLISQFNPKNPGTKRVAGIYGTDSMGSQTFTPLKVVSVDGNVSTLRNGKLNTSYDLRRFPGIKLNDGPGPKFSILKKKEASNLFFL